MFDMSIFASQDLSRARERIARLQWAVEIFDGIRARADKWLVCPSSVPQLAGGWIHNYVCPEHWVALSFDSASPYAHLCPFGEMRTGNEFNAAWRVAEHRRIANTSRDLGLVFAMSDNGIYAEAAREILLQYANNYHNYSGGVDSRSWMLKGRVFNQVLTEALWAVPIVHAYDLVRATFTPEQNSQMIETLLRPISQTMTTAQDHLVYSQKNLKSNYNAWLIAAIGLVGYALDDQALIERSIDGDTGFCAHLSAAVLPDGFEYEGTPYYHNFVALAYAILAEAARANGRDLYAVRGRDGQSIQAMWGAFASLAFSDGTIPAINDGAYYQSGPFDSEICETYEIAFARTRSREFAWLLEQHYADKRGNWAALLFAEEDIANASMPKCESKLFPAIGIAALRGGGSTQEICVPFGGYAGSHSHYDRLGIQVFPFATDPGTPLYGLGSRVDWFQQTAAHNCIVVDGMSQAQCTGKLVEWQTNCNSTTLRLMTDDAYPGVTFTRAITLSGGALADHVSLESDTEHIYDWVMHFDGDCYFVFPKPDPAHGQFAADGAYQFVNMIAKSHGTSSIDNQLQPALCAIILQSGKRFSLSISADTRCEVILASSPSHVRTPQQPRRMLIVRSRARRIEFRTNCTCIN